MEEENHNNKMVELAYVRETERLKHEWRKSEILLKFSYEEQRRFK